MICQYYINLMFFAIALPMNTRLENTTFNVTKSPVNYLNTDTDTDDGVSVHL